MLISVIIPSYNTWPLIGGTLESLQKQTYTGDYEVIVSDCSDDGSDAEIGKRFTDITLLHKDSRDYPGAARNRAIRSARGDIIAMIDSDAAASESWLDVINRNFGTEKDAVGFGGAIENANEHIKPARIAHLLEFGGYGAQWPRRDVRLTPTCNLALRKEVFDRAQFIEDWFGNEDVLLADEIAKMGGRIVFDPEMLVRHHTRDNWQAIYDHQRRLGRDTGRARYRYDLPGSWLARKPGASTLIPLIKIMLLTRRVLGAERKYLPDYLSSMPAIIKALNEFKNGFQEGVALEKADNAKKLRRVDSNHH